MSRIRCGWSVRLFCLLASLAGFFPGSSAVADVTPTTPGAIFHTPLPALPGLLDRLLQETRQLRGFSTGPRSAPRLTVFFDPNCPFCARFWQGLWPRHGDYRIRWIPIAYARPDSNRVAAAILSAPNPEAALVRNEENFHFRQHHGGLMPVYHLSPKLARAIAANTTFWHHWISMLPVFFYRSATGIHLFIGRPTSLQWRHIHQAALPHA